MAIPGHFIPLSPISTALQQQLATYPNALPSKELRMSYPLLGREKRTAQILHKGVTQGTSGSLSLPSMGKDMNHLAAPTHQGSLSTH